MGPTRREFMRGLGVTLASLLTSRCRTTTCYEPVMPTTGPSDSLSAEWRELAAVWYDLDLLARDAHDSERGQATMARMIDDHSAALDKLQQIGEIDSTVTDDLQAAFEGAAHHVWRSNAPVTCYEFWPSPDIEANSDLARQAELLEEMAGSRRIDEATVELIQSSIERDITFLTLPADEQQALIQAVIEAGEESGDYPSLVDLNLDISPDSVTAAGMLVELLLGGQ